MRDAQGVFRSLNLLLQMTRKVLTYLPGHASLVLVLGLSLLSLAISLPLPLLFRGLIDSIFHASQAPLVIRYCLIFLLVNIVMSVLGMVTEIYSYRLNQDIQRSMRSRYHHLLLTRIPGTMILTIIITHDARVLDGVDGISCALWQVDRHGVERLPFSIRVEPIASLQLTNNDMAPE